MNDRKVSPTPKPNISIILDAIVALDFECQKSESPLFSFKVYNHQYMKILS